jgi:hypothetical protein
VIIITKDEASYDSAMAALSVINELRGGGRTYAIRPNVEDSPWVKTVWPNENYL